MGCCIGILIILFIVGVIGVNEKIHGEPRRGNMNWRGW